MLWIRSAHDDLYRSDGSYKQILVFMFGQSQKQALLCACPVAILIAPHNGPVNLERATSNLRINQLFG